MTAPRHATVESGIRLAENYEFREFSFRCERTGSNPILLAVLISYLAFTENLVPALEADGDVVGLVDRSGCWIVCC